MGASSDLRGYVGRMRLPGSSMTLLIPYHPASRPNALVEPQEDASPHTSMSLQRAPKAGAVVRPPADAGPSGAPASHTRCPAPLHWSAEAAHHPLEVVPQAAHMGLQGCCPRSQLGGPLRDDLADFLWALYRVAASLTRWLPCALGNVSTTTCAGLTRPASIAAAVGQPMPEISQEMHRRLSSPRDSRDTAQMRQSTPSRNPRWGTEIN